LEMFESRRHCGQKNSEAYIQCMTRSDFHPEVKTARLDVLMVNSVRGM
jgi:hypothetical protein